MSGCRAHSACEQVGLSHAGLIVSIELGDTTLRVIDSSGKLLAANFATPVSGRTRFQGLMELNDPKPASAGGLTHVGGPAGGRWPQADRPIMSPSQDVLKRGPFAIRVARVIDEVRLMEDSSVLAIVGPWGSGKSSLINLAVAELGSGWKVVRANTWAPPDVAGVIAELFAVIRTALPSDGRGRKAAKLLGEWVPLVTPGLSLIPMFGGSIKEVASGVSDHLARRRAQRPMEQVFGDLSQKLKGLDLRILVILDDIDRLQPDELLTLFKAIRLVASFPGVYYLLAYDEQTVIDVLTSTAIAAGNHERALAYLEKIVQVPLAMPPAEPHYAEKMVTDGLAEVLDRLGTSLTDEQASRFRSLYDMLLRHTLSQPRAVGRFLRQVSAYLPMVDPGELDVVDFLALIHLRSFAPASYRVISRSKRLLTTAETVEAGPSRDEFQAQIMELLSQECGDARNYAWNAIQVIFPDVGSPRPSSGATDQREAARRVSSAEYFDRYFLLGLPVDDMADSTARDALRAIACDELTPARTTAETMITGQDAAVADAVIRKLARYTGGDHVDPTTMQTVARYAVSIPERTPGKSLAGAAEAWAVAALTRMGQAGLSPTGLGSGLSDSALRLLCTSLDRAMAETRSPATRVTTDHVAQEVGRRIRMHLHQRDQANLKFPIVPFAQFISRSTICNDFAGQLNDDLSAGEFTLADLVARFLRIDNMGGQPWIFDIEDEALVAVMSVTRLAELCADSTSADAVLSDRDKADTTWPGRRKAGLAMLPDALQKCQAMPPRPPGRRSERRTTESGSADRAPPLGHPAVTRSHGLRRTGERAMH